MKKLTVKDIFNLKGKRQLIELFVTTSAEARAAEAAGIDMLITPAGAGAQEIREAAPNTFLIMGIGYGTCASKTEAVRTGFDLLKLGADAVYQAASPMFIHAMTQEGIPVVGHVGLVPSKATWTGGLRPVGKTAVQAMQIYRDTLAHQEAGAIAVEFELVPHQTTAEIAKRVDICVISMGSGAAADAQSLLTKGRQDI